MAEEKDIFQELKDTFQKIKELEKQTDAIPKLRIALNNLSERVSQIAKSYSSVRQGVETLETKVDAPRPEMGLAEDIKNVQLQLVNIKQGEENFVITIQNVIDRLVSFMNDTKPAVHYPNGDTSLGQQTKDVDMGGHNIVNVEGSEVATKKYVDDLKGKFVVSGGGGGINRSGVPEANDYAKFTSGGQLAGRSYSEVKTDLDLEIGTDIPALAHASRHQDAGADEVSIEGLAGTPVAITTHEAAADPHTGYRLESADHSHQSTGAQAGKLDHGAALDGLTDDDHTQYQKESEKGAASGYASLDASTKVTEDPANATATPTASKIPIADGSGKLDSWVSASSTTVSGLTEAAIASEVTTGTDAARAVTPDALAGSDYGKRIVMIKVIDDATALTIGDGKFYFAIPAELNGYNLVGAHAFVSTVSTNGLPTYQIYNLTQTADMLTTKTTIDANEYTSYSAATPPVIDTANDDVATGDILRIDKDVAGTGEKGDGVILSFQLP